MALTIDTPPGATPLDPDEARGLIPGHIATQGDLDEWEAANIIAARRWLYAHRRQDVLSEAFCRDLHRRMFDKTWTWAGTFRQSDKNIGVDWRYIGIRLRDVLDDTRYWLANRTYTVDEAATRFHHRLVCVHCFANGNGRHARMMTDAMLRECYASPFTWGSANLVNAGDARLRYLDALRAADSGNIQPLLAFVRS
jgi:Fic-DOC domain mobile mystery protein B